MQHCSQKIGDAYFRTPRNSVTAFVNLLAVLEQNPDASWQELLNHVQVVQDTNPDLQPLDDDDEGDGERLAGAEKPNTSDDDLASFKL
jgi:hypothetical protein